MKKFKFSIDNNPFEVAVTELENGQIDVEVNGSNYIVTIDREGTKAANAPAKAAPVAAPKAAAPKVAPAAAPVAAPAASTGAAKTVKSALPGSVTKLVMEVGQAVKKGDTVKVIAGKDKDKEGKVLTVDQKNNKVVVEGVNMITKHSKPSAANPNGGIIQKEAPFEIRMQNYSYHLARHTIQKRGKIFGIFSL